MPVISRRSPGAPLRVLVIAQSPLARAGLAGLLADSPDLALVGQVSDEAVPDSLDVYRPHVLVWDTGYDPLSLLDALADAAATGVTILALVSARDILQEAASALLEAGVRGVALQDISADGLLSALLAVDAGLVVLHPDAAPGVVARAGIDRVAPAQATLDAFTPREREVLTLVAEGLANKMIARQLGITEHTVKFHLNAILTKLGAQSRTEAVVKATRMGLLAL